MSDERLVFYNPGTLDRSFIEIMGVSAKENEGAIGMFGTGLKYAIATTLRHGGEVTILTGSEVLEFSTEPIELRGKSFERVVMSRFDSRSCIPGERKELPFTTELGIKWEPWMAIREFYSNALDESGGVEWENEEREWFNADTKIFIRGDKLTDVWRNAGNYFIFPNERPEYRTAACDAYQAPDENRSIFYRGICVGEVRAPTLFRYNAKVEIDLTEDRTVKFEFQFKEAIEKAIMSSTDGDFIYRCLTCGDGWFENYMSFTDPHSDTQLSQEFIDCCTKLAHTQPQGMNRDAIMFCERRTKTLAKLKVAPVTRVMQSQIDRAVMTIKRMGFGAVDNYEINVVEWLGQGIFGIAKSGKIYLAVEAFTLGTKFLTSTLLEEFVHCHFGHADHTRGMQTWLFDRIIHMAEEFVLQEAI